MSKADQLSGSPGNSQPDHQAHTQTQRIPQMHLSNLFSILTGLLLLLTFSFLPWFAISISCNNACNSSDASVKLHPDAPSGLTLARDGVVIAPITFLSEATLVPTTVDSIQQDQFRLPLLWILPGMSFLLLLLPLVALFESLKLALVRAGVTLLAFCVSLFIELFYLANTFLAFPLTKNALALDPAASTDLGTITLSTFPIIGFWLALLLTLVGGTFTLGAARWPQRTLMRRLAHLEYMTGRGRYRTYMYSFFPFSVTRPERGAIRTFITCPRCGKVLTLHAASHQRTWLYRSLVALALIASTLLTIFFIQQASLDVGSVGVDPAGHVFLVFLCGCLAVCLLCFLIRVDGINIAQSFFAMSHRTYWPERRLKTSR